MRPSLSPRLASPSLRHTRNILVVQVVRHAEVGERRQQPPPDAVRHVTAIDDHLGAEGQRVAAAGAFGGGGEAVPQAEDLVVGVEDRIGSGWEKGQSGSVIGTGVLAVG